MPPPASQDRHPATLLRLEHCWFLSKRNLSALAFSNLGMPNLVHLVIVVVLPHIDPYPRIYPLVRIPPKQMFFLHLTHLSCTSKRRLLLLKGATHVLRLHFCQNWLATRPVRRCLNKRQFGKTQTDLLAAG